ncbi:MAG TPA: hypothetical protein VKA10_07805, partial [Prolixibacteraceae bacterium]|nr:hypothetical protein [Prolixibacteraceae bacterium]
ETEKGNVPVAFQITGKAGGITFNHLDKGTYKLVVALPKQKGKLARQENDIQEDFQVAFHSGKKIYFIPEPQGLFTIRFSNSNNLESTITPMHELSKKDDHRMIIGKFEVGSKFGGITLKIAALKAKSFQRRINKFKHDAGMSIIRN